MALFGLLGGGGGKDDDPYADILTPGQRNQMLTQGLLAMAGAFADAGMPSRLPIPFGSALGKAAAALGTGQEAGMKAAIENVLAAQKVRDLRSLSQFRTQWFGDQDRLTGLVRDALGGAGAAPAGRSPATVPAGTYVGPGAVAGPSGPIPSRPPWAPPVGLLGGGDTDLAAGSPPSASRGDSGDTDLTAGILPSASGDADLISGGGLLAPAPLNRPAAQRAALTGSEREIADNNFAGLRRPGVMAGPGAGGFQAFGSPQEGLLAVSNQLDRYASGATTGTPLTTIRQIVSTWAPPSENDTETLIRRASGIVGVSPDQPLDVANPEVKAKLTEALIRNEQGGRLPVDQSLIRQVAATGQPQGGTQGENALMRNAPFPTLANAGQGQPINWRADRANLDPNNPANYGPGSPLGMAPGQLGPPDTYIPPQRAGAGPTMQMAQYQQPGAPSSGAAPASQIPQIPVPPGADPAKFNALLLELARRNAAAEVLGMGNPYGSMLSVLQGSPQYKAAVEAATETARRGAGLPYIEEEARRKALGGYEVDIATRGYQAALDRVTAQLKTEGEAANTIQEGGILVSDGKGGTQQIQATRKQAIMAANGLAVPELGIPGIVKPPAGGGDAGFPTAGTPAGKPVLGPGEEAVIKGSAEDLFKARTVAQDAAQSIETTKEARKLLDSGIFAGAGADKVTAVAKIGNALNLTGANTKETVSNTEAYFATVAGNVGRMIKQFGSGTGLSDADREYAAKMAAGQQTLDEASIRKILDINDRAGFNAINRHNTSVAGIRPGASLTPLTVPAPTPYQRVYPEGFVIENPQTGERQIRRNGNWEPVPK